MYDEFKKSIEYQRSIVRALFNSNAIDLKEFETISFGLQQLQAEIEEQRKKTFQYKWSQFFKRKKK